VVFQSIYYKTNHLISGNSFEKSKNFLGLLFVKLMLPCREDQKLTENIQKTVPEIDRSEIIGFIR
jgi:hypothetical protein